MIISVNSPLCNINTTVVCVRCGGGGGGGARGQQLERRKVWRGERGMNVGRICDEGEGMM